MPRKEWTKDEDDCVSFFWSLEPYEVIGEKLGRSPGSVRKRGMRLGLKPPRDYYLTLPQAVRRLGFSRSAVVLAVKRLHMVLRRIGSYAPRTDAQRRAAKTIAPSRGRKPGHRVHLGQATIVVTEAQFERLKAYLLGERKRKSRYKWARGQWGANGRPDRCAGCGRDDRPAKSRDRCGPCFYDERWRSVGVLKAMRKRAERLGISMREQAKADATEERAARAAVKAAKAKAKAKAKAAKAALHEALLAAAELATAERRAASAGRAADRSAWASKHEQTTRRQRRSQRGARASSDRRAAKAPGGAPGHEAGEARAA